MTTEEQQLVERLKPSYVVDAGLNIIMIVLRDHGAAAEAQVLNEWIVANNALKAKAVAALIASEAKVAELQEALTELVAANDAVQNALCDGPDVPGWDRSALPKAQARVDAAEKVARRALEQSK